MTNPMIIWGRCLNLSPGIENLRPRRAYLLTMIFPCASRTLRVTPLFLLVLLEAVLMYSPLKIFTKCDYVIILLVIVYNSFWTLMYINHN